MTDTTHLLDIAAGKTTRAILINVTVYCAQVSRLTIGCNTLDTSLTGICTLGPDARSAQRLKKTCLSVCCLDATTATRTIGVGIAALSTPVCDAHLTLISTGTVLTKALRQLDCSKSIDAPEPKGGTPALVIGFEQR